MSTQFLILGSFWYFLVPFGSLHTAFHTGFIPIFSRSVRFRPAPRLRFMRKLALVLSLLSLTISLFAQTRSLLNLDKHNLAIQGYDPVAYFTDNKPIKGRAEFNSTYSGATYYFASADHKAQFDKEPAKYEPAFGGFCAYGVSRNKLVEIDPEAFQIMDGRLLLQYSKGVRNDFNKDPQGNLAKANSNWPGLVERKAK